MPQLNPDIAFTTDFAHKEGLYGHIVGSTLPLKETEVWNAKQIFTVINEIKKARKTDVFATYMRVTALNVSLSSSGIYLATAHSQRAVLVRFLGRKHPQ